MSTLTLLFKKDCVDLNAIKSAAYKLTDICSVNFNSDKDNFICEFTFLNNSKSSPKRNFEHTFRTMVLDEELRAKISGETEPLRNLILSYAFSKTGLIEDG